MSKLSDSIKNTMRDKAKRLTSGEPHTKVDSSTWTPPEMENAGVKTGLRPLSKRQYKSGGKVHGMDAKKRGDRAMRKSGGRTESADRSKRYLTPDNLINRDVRMANDEREGTKHVGGFKKGGKVHRKHHADGMRVPMPIPRPKYLSDSDYANDPAFQRVQDAKAMIADKEAMAARAAAFDAAQQEAARKRALLTGQKRGGAAKHTDEVQDKKLMHKVLRPSAFKAKGGAAMHHEDCTCKMCWGGAAKSKKADGGKIKWIQGAIKHPGSLHKALHVPEGEKIPAKKLEKATHSHNPKLAKKANLAKTLKRMHHAKGGEVFSGNSETKIPGVVPGGRKAHAVGGQTDANATIRNMMAGDFKSGGRAAHAKGGKAKGKTNININVMPHHPGMPMPAGGPMGGPMAPPPAPPMAPPSGNQPNPAMLAALSGGMGGGRPPMVSPQPPMGGGMPMGRKYGGRAMAQTEHVIDNAAGGGLGRLEKIKAYGEPQKRMK